jgi:hypothetical protein
MFARHSVVLPNTSHINRPVVRSLFLLLLDGICIQKPTIQQSFVQLDAPYADEAMEPMWPQNDNPDTFAALQPFPVAVNLNVESETLQFVSNQQNHLDNHISRQLADNGLANSSTILDTEDRQDIMLDTDESFAFEDNEVIMDASTNVFDVDHSDNLLSVHQPSTGPTYRQRNYVPEAFTAIAFNQCSPLCIYINYGYICRRPCLQNCYC